MSKTLKRTLAGLAMVALLWGGAKIVKPLLQSSSAMAGLGRAQPPRDPETITVTMGGVTMKIPKSYLLFPPSPGGKGPDAVSFGLLTLLPNFTILNRKEFTRPGWHKQVLIMVYYKGYQMSGAALLRAWYTYSNQAKVESGPFGYMYFRHSGFDDLFRGSFKSPRDVVSCRPVSGSLGGPYPYCERTMRIAREIVVQYSYSRAYLAQTLPLDKKVIQFLNQLRTSGPAFKALR